MNVFSLIYLRVLFKTRVKRFLNTLPFFKHKTYTPFLIIGHPRTGTSLLHTYLNSHSNILSLNEPLANTTDGKILFRTYSKYIKVVGFKYFYEYIHDSDKRNALIQLVSEFKIKVLKIHRKNYLRTFVSLRIAEQTQEWSSTGKSSMNLINKKVKLSKEECINAFSNYINIEKETNAILKQYNIPIYEIDYEILDVDPTPVMEGVHKFLEVSSQTSFSLLIKQNPEKISDLIVNYNALKDEFKGSQYEQYFEE
jgi:LPS sulfotransferase NodH